MTYSPLEVLVGSENGFLLGSFVWEDSTAFALLGIFYNKRLKRLYLLAFFNTIVFKFGGSDNEMD